MPISQVIEPVVIILMTPEMDLLEARSSRRHEQMRSFFEMLVLYPRALRPWPVRRTRTARPSLWFRLLRIPRTQHSSRRSEPPCGISDSASSFPGDLMTFFSCLFYFTDFESRTGGRGSAPLVGYDSYVFTFISEDSIEIYALSFRRNRKIMKGFHGFKKPKGNVKHTSLLR